MTKNEHLNQGFKLFSKKNYTQALKSFKSAIKIDPNFDLAYNALAEVYNQMGELDKALQMAKKLVEISPDDPIAHTALSRLYVQKGMIEEAEKEMAISNQLSAGL